MIVKGLGFGMLLPFAVLRLVNAVKKVRLLS
jgi:hypothetical protein